MSARCAVLPCKRVAQVWTKTVRHVRLEGAELRRQSLGSHRQFTSIQRPRNIAEADIQATSPPNKITVQVSGSESKRHAPKLNNKPKDITPIKSLVRPDLLGAWSDTPFRLMPPFG